MALIRFVLGYDNVDTGRVMMVLGSSVPAHATKVSTALNPHMPLGDCEPNLLYQQGGRVNMGGLEMGPLMKRLCSHEDLPIDCGLRIAIVIAMDLDLFFEQIGEGRSDLTGQCRMATGKVKVKVIEMECRVPKSKVRYRCVAVRCGAVRCVAYDRVRVQMQKVIS